MWEKSKRMTNNDNATTVTTFSDPGRGGAGLGGAAQM
jgi:hypothetical protein